MGIFHNRLSVYERDFAYPHSFRKRSLMSHPPVHELPAQTFAEYVCLHNIDPAGALEDPFISYDCGDNAPARDRPALPFRLHSHRLLVQANAKNLRKRLLSGPLVSISVGSDENRRQWRLHYNLLCHHSEQLHSELTQPPPPSDDHSQTDGAHTPRKTPRKLNAPPREEEYKLDLKEYDPQGFELLVKWLYQGKLDDVAALSDERIYDYAVACHALHQICARFGLPMLANQAMDQYRKALSQSQLVPDAAELNQIYRSSPEGTPFRKLMVRIAARQIMDPDNERDAEAYRECFENNPSFAVDLVNAIKEGSGGGILFDDPTEGEECDYHDHQEGSNGCPNKGKKRQGRSRRLSFRSAVSTSTASAITTSGTLSMSSSFHTAKAHLQQSISSPGASSVKSSTSSLNVPISSIYFTAPTQSMASIDEVIESSPSISMNGPVQTTSFLTPRLNGSFFTPLANGGTPVDFARTVASLPETATPPETPTPVSRRRSPPKLRVYGDSALKNGTSASPDGQTNSDRRASLEGEADGTRRRSPPKLRRRDSGQSNNSPT